MKEPIVVRGARTHNLRAIDCEIPPRALTVVTGVSGSGKSSLVFDTLYAEGQRRFVQSMSTYTRLFLERMERPDVDFVSHIPPAIALAQKNTIRNARSTVGTITEINDHLRLLFTHAGEMSCVACGGRVQRDDPDTALTEIERLPAGTQVTVLAPLEIDGLPLDAVLSGLVKQGYRRVLAHGQMVLLEDDGGIPDPLAMLAAEGEAPYGSGAASARGGKSARAKSKAKAKGKVGAKGRARGPQAAEAVERGAKSPAVLDVVIDRLTAGRSSRARWREAIEAAFALARGRTILQVVDTAKPGSAPTAIPLDRRFSCRGCGRAYADLTPNLFSFNSPLGACPTCEGFGRVTGIDFDKVIPDPSRTLTAGAVAPWTTPSGLEMQEWLLRVARRHGVRTNVPWSSLEATERELVLAGEPRDAERRKGERRFPGVSGFFRWLEGKRYKTHVRIMLARYRGYTPCDQCHGARLRPEALAVRIGGHNIAELAELPIPGLIEWIDGGLELDAAGRARTQRLLAEVRGRLGYLVDVGLEYLRLGRQTRTLSGGEAQRIHLASALGSALTDTLYCLDEPTVGLHARDSTRLLGVLRKLTTAGNTVVLVEHDPVLIEGADHVLDLGPGGGALGGKVLYAGSPEDMVESGEASGSQTGMMLGARGERTVAPQRGAAPRGVTIRGARENNLKNLTVTIPYGRLTCITGVSGSGKSTLVEQVLYQNSLRARGLAAEPGACDAIEGLDQLGEIVLMTQAPVGRSSRSNPATYLKAYDEIRRLFAATPVAVGARIKPGHFSFNTAGGRCETCCGMGVVTLEMHFMADLTVTCDACGGRRFQPRVLEVRLRGRDINQVLAMTVDEAHEFFADAPRVRDRLVALRAVGLGYLTLGQSTATLSGGEAQRLKLASFVDEGAASANRLLIFDEPTTGLHLSDVARLVGVLHALVERGHTVLVVEHNLDFIAAADWLIDLGPGGGDHGGEVVALGTPLDLARRGGTPTADALGALLARPSRDSAPPDPARRKSEPGARRGATLAAGTRRESARAGRG